MLRSLAVLTLLVSVLGHRPSSSGPATQSPPQWPTYGASLPHGRYDREIFAYIENIKADTGNIHVNPGGAAGSITDYYYRMQGGVRLPVLVLSKITKFNSRNGADRAKDRKNDVSAEAKRNCGDMGKLATDDYGHLISYVNGGPGEFYNVIPQTKAVNRAHRIPGQLTVPQWKSAEGAIRDAVRDGEIVYQNVSVYYEPNNLRPISVGVAETFVYENRVIRNTAALYDNVPIRSS